MKRRTFLQILSAIPGIAVIPRLTQGKIWRSEVNYDQPKRELEALFGNAHSEIVEEDPYANIGIVKWKTWNKSRLLNSKW